LRVDPGRWNILQDALRTTPYSDDLLRNQHAGQTDWTAPQWAPQQISLTLCHNRKGQKQQNEK